MIPPDAGSLHAKPHPLWNSRRLWSLWDMINFRLGDFWIGLLGICAEQKNCQMMASAASGPVDEQSHLRIKDTIERSIEKCVTAMTLPEAQIAAIKLQDMFNRYSRRVYTYAEMAGALDRLYDDIQIGMRQEYFFRYPRDIATSVARATIDWKEVLDAFPSSRREIETGMDCYALGDYSGSIFHMIRIAELGLRAIARERGVESVGRDKPLEWGTWQDVFQAIEAKLKEVRQSKAGSERDKELSFYDTSLSDLRRLQGYRDPTMHFRDDYGRGEAYDAIHRVKSLMMALSAKICEID
jgi:hypothetical protein